MARRRRVPIQVRCGAQLWIVLCMLSACSGDLDPLAVGSENKVVTGIIVRDETGRVLGTWRHPPPSGELQIETSPNPFDPAISIKFTVDRAQRGRVDVFRLRAPQEATEPSPLWIGSTIPFGPGDHVATLLSTSSALPEGLLQFNFRPELYVGDVAVPQFFRIRVAFEDGRTGISDILYWPLDWSKLPADLHQILFP